MGDVQTYIDLDNLQKYKTGFIGSNSNLDKYDDVELFLFKGMIKNSNDNIIAVPLNPNNIASISLRICLYALIEYSNTNDTREISYSYFSSWLLANHKYSQYLPLLYYSHKLKLNKEMIEKFNVYNNDLSKQEFEQLKFENLNEFNTNIDFNMDEFNRSKFSTKRFTLYSKNLLHSIMTISHFCLSLQHRDIKNNLPINKLETIKSNTRLKIGIKLN